MRSDLFMVYENGKIKYLKWQPHLFETFRPDELLSPRLREPNEQNCIGLRPPMRNFIRFSHQTDCQSCSGSASELPSPLNLVTKLDLACFSREQSGALGHPRESDF